MEGFLLKRGHKRKNWKKRYFVFDDSTRTLSYYTAKNRKVMKGSIQVRKIFDMSGRSDNKEHRFDFYGADARDTHGDVQLEVSAPNEAEKAAWIRIVGEMTDVQRVETDGADVSIQMVDIDDPMSANKTEGKTMEADPQLAVSVENLPDFMNQLKDSQKTAIRVLLDSGSERENLNETLQESFGLTTEQISELLAWSDGGQVENSGEAKDDDLDPEHLYSDVAMEGYLYKMNNHGVWQKRWFKFNYKHRTISYFSDESRMSILHRGSAVAANSADQKRGSIQPQQRNSLLPKRASVTDGAQREPRGSLLPGAKLITRSSAKTSGHMDRVFRGYMAVQTVYDMHDMDRRQNCMDFFGVSKHSGKIYMSVSAHSAEIKQQWLAAFENEVEVKAHEDREEDESMQGLTVGEGRNRHAYFQTETETPNTEGNSARVGMPMPSEMPSKQSVGDTALKAIADTYAQQAAPRNWQLKERIAATGTTLIAPVAGAGLGVAGLLAPNATKNTVVSKGLRRFEDKAIAKLSELNLHVTDGQREEVHKALKMGILQGDYWAAKGIIQGVALRVIRDPANSDKIKSICRELAVFGSKYMESKLAVALTSEQIDLLAAGLCEMVQGDYSNGTAFIRRAAASFIKNEQQLLHFKRQLRHHLYHSLGMDPKLVDLLQSTQEQISGNMNDDMSVNFDKLVEIGYKVQRDLLSHLEHAIFRPAIMGMCGGEEKMPTVVQVGVVKMAVLIWREVQRDLDAVMVETINSKSGGPSSAQKDPFDETPVVRGCWRRFRAWYLYHNFPYDKNMWSKARDPWWLFFNAILCMPLITLRVCYYALMLFCLDRTDEAQLINFIKSFKAWHFLTAGCLGLTMGALLQFKCIMFPSQDPTEVYVEWLQNLNDQVSNQAGFLNDTAGAQAAVRMAVRGAVRDTPGFEQYMTSGSLQECHLKGPGSMTGYIIELCSFFMNIFLVWFAFSLLPHSKKQNTWDKQQAEKEVREVEKRERTDHRRRAKMDKKKAATRRKTLRQTVGDSLGISSNRQLKKVPSNQFEANLEKHAVDKKAWHVLKFFLLWDSFAFTFLSCVIFLLFWLWADFSPEKFATIPTWRLQGFLYWLRVFYGLCAWPFILFILPFEGTFFKKVFTSARDTGYDPYGRLRITRVVRRDRQLQLHTGTTVRAKGEDANVHLARHVPLLLQEIDDDPNMPTAASPKRGTFVFLIDPNLSKDEVKEDYRHRRLFRPIAHRLQCVASSEAEMGAWVHAINNNVQALMGNHEEGAFIAMEGYLSIRELPSRSRNCCMRVLTTKEVIKDRWVELDRDKLNVYVTRKTAWLAKKKAVLRKKEAQKEQELEVLIKESEGSMEIVSNVQEGAQGGANSGAGTSVAGGAVSNPMWANEGNTVDGQGQDSAFLSRSGSGSRSRGSAISLGSSDDSTSGASGGSKKQSAASRGFSNASTEEQDDDTAYHNLRPMGFKEQRVSLGRSGGPQSLHLATGTRNAEKVDL